MGTDAPVPHALSELRGSLHGNIGLPARMFWSGPNPRAIRWNLADPSRRRDLYEIVLVEGTLDDMRTLINGRTSATVGPDVPATLGPRGVATAHRHRTHGSLSGCRWTLCKTASPAQRWRCPRRAPSPSPAAAAAPGFVTRATKDIDLFTEIDDQEALQVTAALRDALQQQGLVIRDAERPPDERAGRLATPHSVLASGDPREAIEQ
jgi:hypothetical protein